MHKEKEWQSFRFAIYDVYNENKVTEKGLFKLMQHASLRPLDISAEPTQILKLNQVEKDIFLDIFANDYIKIIQAFAAKKAANRRSRDQFQKRKILG